MKSNSDDLAEESIADKLDRLSATRAQLDATNDPQVIRLAVAGILDDMIADLQRMLVPQTPDR